MLQVKKPLLTLTPILHRNYERALNLYGALTRSPIQDKTVALIGPPQVGKSLIMSQCFHDARADYADRDQRLRPVIGFKAETSKDGRVSQRFILLQALRELDHPVYKHVGALDELEHYVPQRGCDETTLRLATDRALSSRGTKQTYIDEAHHLTHTTDTELQDRLFQSIKTRFAVDRTLFMAGGYEMAYHGLFNSPHFSGRLIVVEFGPYTESKQDIDEVARVLCTYEQVLPIQKKGLLVKNTLPLLRANNGTIGQIEMQLFQCRVRAESQGKRIDEDMLFEFMPTEAARAVIEADIDKGREALKRCSKSIQVAPAKMVPPPPAPGPQSGTKAKKRKPFSRAPKRRKTGMDHIKVGGQ